MSILSVMPAEWWEPADLEDEDDDAPPPAITTDLLTVSRGVVWLTVSDPTNNEE
jgi:hypothetical protein